MAEHLPIAHLSSECATVFKKGGLGDCVHALASALALRAPNTVLLPHYRGLQLGSSVDQFTLTYGGIKLRTHVRHVQRDAVDVLLVGNELIDTLDSAYRNPYWEESNIAGHVVFAAASLMALARRFPDGLGALMVHDWHPAAVFLFERELEALACPSIAVVHNYQSQAQVIPEELDALPEETHARAEAVIARHGLLSLSAAAADYADSIVVVSEPYLEEICNDEVGHQSNHVLRANRHKAVGIHNGVDVARWSPGEDPHIAVRYDQDSFENKAQNKSALQCELGLPEDPEQFLVVFNSRLTWQKGLSLLLLDADSSAEECYRSWATRRAHLVIHGDTDDSSMLHMKALQEDLKRAGVENVSILIPYEDPRAHRLLAGADCLLHPSRFEPCGLTPMYALCYGTIPIVGCAGGQTQAIQFEDSALGETCGFIVSENTTEAVFQQMAVAETAFRDHERWRAMQRAAIAGDFSWARVIDHYHSVIANARVKRLKSSSSCS